MNITKSAVMQCLAVIGPTTVEEILKWFGFRHPEKRHRTRLETLLNSLKVKGQIESDGDKLQLVASTIATA